MKPYYEKDGISIYHGDCREVLPAIGEFSAVITDPPFGISDSPLTGGVRRGKREGGDNTWHPESEWDKAIDPAICRVACEATRLVAWFGHWRKREEVSSAMPHPLRAEIVWAKDCHVGPPCPVAMRDERIWLFSSVGVSGKRFETSVWDEPIIPTWERKHHKNEKPTSLMKRLLLFLVEPGARICDPCMGSGTTLVAAKELGLQAVGIDIHERYCEIAAKRLAQSVLNFAG